MLRSSSSPNCEYILVLPTSEIRPPLQRGCNFAGAGIPGGAKPHETMHMFLTPLSSSGNCFRKYAIPSVVAIHTITRMGMAVAGFSNALLARNDVMRPASHSNILQPANAQSSFKQGMTSPLSMFVRASLSNLHFLLMCFR